jgi:Family of unknown function (DUF6236)
LAGDIARQNDAPKVGLYFPYIHFRDEDWLKTSVLYWDRVARIVPIGYPPDDSQTVRQLQDDFRFVVNLAPDPGVLDEVGTAFINLLGLRGDELRRHYALQSESGGARTVEGWPVHTEILAPKLQPELDAALRETGLSIDRPDRSGLGSVYLHPRMTSVYMGALAQRMAEVQRCQLLSDEPRNHIAASGLSVERLGQALLDLTPLPLGREEVESEMAIVALRMALPDSLRDVPLERLIEFRRRHREELNAFQRFVAGLSSPDGPLGNLPTVRDPRMLKAQLEAYYERRFEPDLSRLRDAFRGIGVNLIDSTLGISLPSTIPIESSVAAAGVHTSPFHALFAAAALGVGLLKVARKGRASARSVVAESPISFLMFAGEELTPQSLFRQLQLQARHVALGV